MLRTMAHTMMSCNSPLRGEYFDPQTFRIARTQREAGIDQFGWESRIRPLRPLSYDIGLGIGAVMAIGAACFLI
jgi:hypothetical protein